MPFNQSSSRVKKLHLYRGINISLFDDFHTATMARKKHRSQSQRRHDSLLYKSHRDPLTYYAKSLEDMTETVKQHRETARTAEADAESNKKALLHAQNQVGPPMGVNGLEWELRPTSLLGSRRNCVQRSQQ